MIKMIYVCDACKYLFESESEAKQCSDCGKFEVRPAEQAEIEENESRQSDGDEEGPI